MTRSHSQSSRTTHARSSAAASSAARGRASAPSSETNRNRAIDDRTSLPGISVSVDQPSTLSTATASVDILYGTAATLLWTVTSAPVGGVATFDDDTAASPVVSFTLYGDYVLRCTATNAAGSAYDEATVTFLVPLHTIFAGAITTDQRPPTSGSNITLVSSTTISQWNDSSGNGNHYVRSTVINQPIYHEGTGPNSLNYAEFEAGDSINCLSLANGGVTGGYAAFFALMRVVTAPSGGGTAGYGDIGTGDNLGVYDHVGIDISSDYTRASFSNVSNVAAPAWPSTWCAVALYQDGTDRVLQIDGADVLRVSGMSALTADQDVSQFLSIGSAGEVDFVQFMFVRGAVTPAQASSAQRYLMHIAGLS